MAETTQTAGEVLVRELWRRLDDRRWEEAGALLAPDAVVRYPDSGRLLTGPAEFARFNGDYPGRSRCTVLRTLARPQDEGELVAAEVRVDNDQRGRFFCAGFYLAHGRLVTDAQEYWVGPPED